MSVRVSRDEVLDANSTYPLMVSVYRIEQDGATDSLLLTDAEAGYVVQELERLREHSPARWIRERA